MKIKVFAGFQFVSKYFGKLLFEGAINRAVEQINEEAKYRYNGKTIQVEYEIIDLASGKDVLSSISEKIATSDITLFELSDKNPNVLFELGYAFAMKKKIILLINERLDISEIPSDLRGYSVKKYSEKYFEISVAEELQQKVFSLIDERVIRASVFQMQDCKMVNIVCPEIPEHLRSKYSIKQKKDFLHKLKFGDIDSLNIISLHIARQYPNLEIKEQICSEVSEEIYKDDLICIGGPGWNTLTRDIISSFSIPIEYGDYSDGVEDFYIKNKITGKVYRSTFSEENRIIGDIGIFVKLPSPVNLNKNIYLLNGIQTYGVYGVALSFCEEEIKNRNIEMLDDILGEACESYIIIFEFAIFENMVIPSSFKMENLFVYDKKTNTYTSI